MEDTAKHQNDSTPGRLKIPTVGEHVEKLEPSFISAEIIKNGAVTLENSLAVAHRFTSKVHS